MLLAEKLSYNKRMGSFGEGLARDYLIKKGYKIIGSNIKAGYQELDIIAKKENCLVFIEVKTRTSMIYGSADETVFSKKIKNLKTGVSKYLQSYRGFYKDLRIDLISIDLDRIKQTAKIKHYQGIT